MPPPTVPTAPLPAGFRAGAVHCGLRKDPAHPDLGLLVADRALPAAALFTQNRLLGAHVHLCRDHLQRSGGLVRAVLVNARNANCATGEAGVRDARTVCAALAERLGCPGEQVLMCSTGPIGAPLPRERILAALEPLVGRLAPGDGGPFARAILTTDTFAKSATAELLAAGAAARVTGFAKGAGMIHPDMATMLAFVLADAAPAGGPEALLPLLRRAADRSFHRVTVDGDTSPNDTLILWAGGGRCEADDLERAATAVGRELARAIARDGEGASRLITVEVRGAADEREAGRVGRTVATSPLVKTAVAGRDPNWGRILSAAGRAGVPFEPDAARVWVGPAIVFERGVPHPEREPEAHRHLVEEREVVLGIDLGRGAVAADFWTCDLTADYVQINADYRT